MPKVEKEPVVVDDVSEGAGEPVVEPTEEVNPRSKVSDIEHEHEQFYRKLRRYEMLDDLAMKVLNLANDTHTNELKQAASKYVLSRFEK